MPLTRELNRAVRHIAAPLIVIAVERGWIPERFQQDALELTIIVATILIIHGVSWWRDSHRRPAGKE